MEINEQNPQDPRQLTDRSLEQERTKTDRVITSDLKKIEIQSDQTTTASRLAADAHLDQVRSNLDAALEQAPGLATPAALADAILQQERAAIDRAHEEARIQEDRIRAKERFEKRLLATALLEKERRRTDTHLEDEREKADEIARANEAAKNALVTRDQFLAVVSHDLRNPLRAVSVGASLLRRSLGGSDTDPAHWTAFLEAIEISAATMDRLITDLLDVERMAHGGLVLHRVQTDIGEILDECARLFTPLVVSKSFSLTVEAPIPPVSVPCDPDRVLQVLSNLVGNALKFAPPGSAIRLCAARKAEAVEIAVEDNGPGIADSELERVFERFSQLKPDGRGLGLGLCISKWIVEAHQGRIWVESTPGSGSVFRFTLPVRT